MYKPVILSKFYILQIMFIKILKTILTFLIKLVKKNWIRSCIYIYYKRLLMIYHKKKNNLKIKSKLSQ